MTNIYFVRHAHSTYTPDEMEWPLSEKGYLDALRVTELLIEENIDVVVSSPHKRAFQTVQGTADFFHKKIEIVEECIERLLTTSPAENFTYAITKVWEDYNFSWEGSESNFVAQQRGIKGIHRILDKYKNKNIVIGTHGNIMVLIMNYLNHQYDFTFWKELDMPDIYKFTFEGIELKEVKRIWRRIPQ